MSLVVVRKDRFEVAKAVADARHFIKCRAGSTCTWCGKMSNEYKEQCRRKLEESAPVEHYRKCRGGAARSCFCSITRCIMNARKQNLFPDKPFSLVFLSVCAIPLVGPAVLISHPFGEEVARMRWCAIVVQRKWRHYRQEARTTPSVSIRCGISRLKA